jgi:hypothetical protein
VAQRSRAGDGQAFVLGGIALLELGRAVAVMVIGLDSMWTDVESES